MFETDYEDGALDVLATGELPLELVAAAKALAHWVSTGIPLALLAPVLGVLLNLDIATYPALVAAMLIGTPAVSFIGAIGAALTLQARRGGLLLALIALPLYVPTLIFGISAYISPRGTGRRSAVIHDPRRIIACFDRSWTRRRGRGAQDPDPLTLRSGLRCASGRKPLHPTSCLA